MITYDIVEHGKPLQRTVRETPRPTGTDVLLRVTRSGVCHSDLHIWDGYFDLGGGKRLHMKDRGMVLPFTMGHEPFGVVEALGPRARGAHIGQRRLIYPWIGCGTCPVCRDGMDNYCLKQRFLGIFRPGAYASHVLVPHPRYLVDASGIDEAFAATLACSGLTAYSAIAKLPLLHRRDWIALIGCGGLGLVAVSLLKAMGVRHVIACDIEPARLSAARRLGAAKTLDTRAADAPSQLQALAGGYLAAAIDFVGMPATHGLAYPSLRKGGRYILCGLFGGEVTMSLPPIAQRAVSVAGSYVGSLQELKALVAFVKKRKPKRAPVTTRRAEDVNAVLAELQAGNVLGRTVLDFEHLE